MRTVGSFGGDPWWARRARCAVWSVSSEALRGRWRLRRACGDGPVRGAAPARASCAAVAGDGTAPAVEDSARSLVKSDSARACTTAGRGPLSDAGARRRIPPLSGGEMRTLDRGGGSGSGTAVSAAVGTGTSSTGCGLPPRAKSRATDAGTGAASRTACATLAPGAGPAADASAPLAGVAPGPTTASWGGGAFVGRRCTASAKDGIAVATWSSRSKKSSCLSDARAAMDGSVTSTQRSGKSMRFIARLRRADTSRLTGAIKLSSLMVPSRPAASVRTCRPSRRARTSVPPPEVVHRMGAQDTSMQR